MDNIPTSRIKENMTDVSKFSPVEYDKAITFINREKIENYKFSIVSERLVGIFAKTNYQCLPRIHWHC